MPWLIRMWLQSRCEGMRLRWVVDLLGRAAGGLDCATFFLDDCVSRVVSRRYTACCVRCLVRIKKNSEGGLVVRSSCVD